MFTQNNDVCVVGNMCTVLDAYKSSSSNNNKNKNNTGDVVACHEIVDGLPIEF